MATGRFEFSTPKIALEHIISCCHSKVKTKLSSEAMVSGPQSSSGAFLYSSNPINQRAISRQVQLTVKVVTPPDFLEYAYRDPAEPAADTG